MNDDLFDSGWVTHETHNLFVSRAIVGVCNAIQDRFPSLEWAILLKGDWTRHGYEIGLTYAVPKQTVSAGAVKFDDADVEKYKLEGYNVVLHSHHNMGIAFSGSDHDTLTDSSFGASLLYSKGEIKQATCSIIVKEGVRVAIEPKIVVVDFLAELPDWIETVITKTQIQKYDYTTRRDGYDYNKYEDNKWTKRKWNNTTKKCEKVEKIWNKKKCQWDWEDEIEDDKTKILVRLDDGSLIESYTGLPVTEQELLTIGPHEILTEDEDIKRICGERKVKNSKIDDLDYSYCW
jgi:hypothetical protein